MQCTGIWKSAVSHINMCSLFVTKCSQTVAEIVLKEHQSRLYQGLDLQHQDQNQGQQFCP